MDTRLRVATFGWVLPVAWAACLGARAADAHGPLHEQIAALTLRIQEDPTDASLYLRRGELRGLHQEWVEALADYDRAAELEPGLAAVDLARGRTLLLAQRFNEAAESLDRYLARHSDDPEALASRARARIGLGESRAAATDYARAVARWEQLGAPKPDHYVEWARALEAAGDPRAALGAFDAGIAKLGPLVSLELPAIELELAEARYDAALARLAAASSSSPRAEPWLARRGEILERAGRLEEARATYEEALKAIERLPRRSRVTELESSVRTALARLGGKP